MGRPPEASWSDVIVAARSGGKSRAAPLRVDADAHDDPRVVRAQALGLAEHTAQLAPCDRPVQRRRGLRGPARRRAARPRHRRPRGRWAISDGWRGPAGRPPPPLHRPSRARRSPRDATPARVPATSGGTRSTAGARHRAVRPTSGRRVRGPPSARRRRRDRPPACRRGATPGRRRWWNRRFRSAGRAARNGVAAAVIGARRARRPPRPRQARAARARMPGGARGPPPRRGPRR